MKFNSLDPQFEFCLPCIWHKHKFTLKRMMNEQTDRRTDGHTDRHGKYTLYGINLNCLSEESREFVLFSHSFCEICSRNNMIFHQTWIKKDHFLVFHYLHSIKLIGIFSHITKLHLYVWIKVSISSSFRSIFFALYVWYLISNSLKGLQLRIFMGFFYIWNIERKKNHWNKSTHLKMKYWRRKTI